VVNIGPSTPESPWDPPESPEPQPNPTESNQMDIELPSSPTILPPTRQSFNPSVYGSINLDIPSSDPLVTPIRANSFRTSQIRKRGPSAPIDNEYGTPNTARPNTPPTRTPCTAIL